MLTPEYFKIPIRELDMDLGDGMLDDSIYLTLLEKISNKINGLSNIATFADLKNVVHSKRLRSDISKEFLSIHTAPVEVPGKELYNDGTSSNPLDYDYNYLYPIKEEGVAPPVQGITNTDITTEYLQPYTGYLYGTVATHECDPKMKCPKCNGSGKCNDCHGRGEVRCSDCGGRGTCPDCAGRGEERCRECNGTGRSYNGKTCYSCNGTGWKKCFYCGGTGNCSRCGGAGVLTCGSCGGSGDCPRCGGEGTVVCTRCNGSGFYQTLLSFRTARYAKRLLFPPLFSDMGEVVRTSFGNQVEGTVLKQWKNWKEIAIKNSSVLDNSDSLIQPLGMVDSEPILDEQQRQMCLQYIENVSSLNKDDKSDLSYRETWSVMEIPETVIEYNVCGDDYSVHIVGTEQTVAYCDFPQRLRLFDENGESVPVLGSGQTRKIALSKLAAYIFNADGMDLGETKMLSRICHCMGYSNKERWRLLDKLNKYGPEMPFAELKEEIATILKSKKTLCFAWHCIAIDNKASQKELEVFDRLVKEFHLSGDELESLKVFTASKFSKLPEDQIIREYIESKPRKVSIQKIIRMIVSGVIFIVSFLCQFVFETEDLFTLLLLFVSFTSMLLSIPFKQQSEYTETRKLTEPRPAVIYGFILLGFILSIWRFFVIW